MMIHQHRKPRVGVSRLEVLVLLLIVPVLVAVIAPAIQQSREAARRSQCKNNLKQMGLGLYNYHDAWDAFPYGCVGNPKLPPDERWSWCTFMGPMMAQMGYAKIDLNQAWDDPAARPLLAHGRKNPEDPEFRPLVAFPDSSCPSAVRRTYSDGQPFMDYVGLAGVGKNGPELPRTLPRAGAWAYESATTLDDVTDGTANTLFVMETAEKNGCWLAGGPPTTRAFVPNAETPIGRPGQFGGIHAGGGMALFMDGEVSFLSEKTDDKVFAAWVTISESPIE